MKIGYLLQGGEEVRRPPFNGPANHIRQVFKELTRQGHAVTILFRLDEKIWKSDDLVEFVPIDVHQIDRGWLRWVERVIRRIQYQFRLPYFGFFESLRFALACRQELAGCAVFYERLSWMAYGGTLASRWQKIPWVLEYNGNPLADLEAKGISPRGFQRWLAMRLMHWSIGQSMHVVATGEGWRKSCISDWGVPDEKSSTIENGTDLVQRLPREELRSFRIVNLDQTGVRLVYLGGFYPWHGIDILLRAVSRLLQRGVRLKLTMIGAGDGFEAAQELASNLNVLENVTFMGRLTVDEYGPILADSDIGLSPYCGWEEYSGLKIFDYKAAGLACISSGKDGHPWVLKHDVTGWIVPPCDEDALAEAIQLLASDTEKRRQMGRAARLDAENQHSWAHTAEKIEAVLHKVINE